MCGALCVARSGSFRMCVCVCVCLVSFDPTTAVPDAHTHTHCPSRDPGLVVCVECGGAGYRRVENPGGERMLLLLGKKGMVPRGGDPEREPFVGQEYRDHIRTGLEQPKQHNHHNHNHNWWWGWSIPHENRSIAVRGLLRNHTRARERVVMPPPRIYLSIDGNGLPRMESLRQVTTIPKLFTRGVQKAPRMIQNSTQNDNTVSPGNGCHSLESVEYVGSLLRTQTGRPPQVWKPVDVERVVGVMASRRVPRYNTAAYMGVSLSLSLGRPQTVLAWRNGTRRWNTCRRRVRRRTNCQEKEGHESGPERQHDGRNTRRTLTIRSMRTQKRNVGNKNVGHVDLVRNQRR